ncbi:MAG: hypothetical protein ACOYOF_11695 [Verrucomicrobiaceae bacterium]
MKTASLLTAICLACASASVRSEEDIPVPEEIQKLAQSFFAAFTTGDEVAVSACWHSPEVLGKAKADEAVKEAGSSPTEIDVAKETEREVKKQTKNMAVTLQRVAQLRALVAKYFGDVALLKLVSVEIDTDEDAPLEAPAYDELDIRLLASEGTHLKISMDNVVKLEGVWKFKGRIDDDLTIELPDED